MNETIRHDGGRQWLITGLAVIIGAALAGQLGPLVLRNSPADATLIQLLIVGFGTAVLIGVVFRPEVGVLVLVALLTTNASDVMVRTLAVPSPLQWLTVAVAAGLGLRMWRGVSGEPKELVLDPLLVPLSLYLTVILASSLLASEPANSDQRLMEHLKGLLVFLVVTNAVRSRENLRHVVWAIVLAGAFLASISMLQVMTGRFDSNFLGFGQMKVAQIVGEIREPRISGPLTDPNFYAQLLVALFPLALARFWDEGRPAHKLLAGSALLVIIAATFLTYSRGGAVALALVLLLVLISRRIRVRIIVAGLVASAALLLVPSNFTGRLSTLQQVIPGVASVEEEGADSSFRQRQLFMAVAWEMFRDRPLLGVGAGNYTERYEEYSAQVGTNLRSFDKFGGPYFPHSTPFEILAETGLAGLVTFAAIILTALAGLVRAVRAFGQSGHRHEAHLTIAIGAGLTGYLATSVLLHAHYVHYFWLLISLVAAARQVSKRSAEDER